MAYFRCINNKDYLEILKGINNPSNNDGVNGQVYLKYADYNSLYDFKEYIEVGSTAGAYIDSGYVLHSTNEYEIKVQYTDTPVNDGYAFGAWRSNGGSYVDFYGGTMRFSVGNEQSITFDTNAHIYKATQSDMLFDGSSVGTPNWNLVDANYTFGIFTDGSRKTSNRINNTKIYYIKIWDNNELVRYFVPVERKSDNEAGMLDIITGIFYDNDGTQSFTVGGTPSLTFDYPITQAYSKIDSTWQNLIGTDVRKIMSGQKYNYNYVVTGTFTTASIADTEVDVYCGFEPDIVYVEMEFSNGITKAIGYNGMNHSMWDLTPIEDRVYSVEIGTPSQTGISNFTSTGFKYNAHAGNTLNKNCTYCAIKLNPTTVDDYVTIKKVYMRVYPGQETSGDNLQFSDDGINWDVTVNYQQCNQRSNAVIVKDVLQVYYESPNWYIACASLFAKDENNNNYRMYDVMWRHHYNGIQPANFTGWIPNFLDE